MYVVVFPVIVPVDPTGDKLIVTLMLVFQSNCKVEDVRPAAFSVGERFVR